MGIIDTVKTAAELAAQIANAELKSALLKSLIDTQNDALALQEQVSTLQKENDNLRASLDDKEESQRFEREELVLARGVWWRRGAKEAQAYCPSCWAKDRLFIPISQLRDTPHLWGGRCPTCNAIFDTIYFQVDLGRLAAEPNDS